ncbi:MAG: hypothetical protein IJI74_01665 [Firmicutes bacterium]|nr:hypothetical protein [Bacillota bacterium]
MSKPLILVTGYFGAPIEETARGIAERENFAYLSLDEEVVRRDGRSIHRLVMMNGEHGYRNTEYEILNEINEDPDRDALVISCGDGVLYDDMSREIAQANTLVIAGEDLSTDELWERARTMGGTYHAFMFFGSDDEKRQAFERYLERQRVLFEGAKDRP